MTEIVNLTRRTVTVYDRAGATVLVDLPTEAPPATATARVEHVSTVRHDGAEVPVVRHVFEDPRDLPEPEAGVLFVVDYATLQAAAHLGRSDLAAPDTARESAVRDAGGRIVGVRQLRVL